MIGDTTSDTISDAAGDPIGEAKGDVIGAAISDVIMGNKSFRGFKKCRCLLVFLIVQFWFLNHLLKWKDCQVDPIGFAPLLLSGDKTAIFTKYAKHP